MKKVNLRDLYPDVYKTDHFVEVTEDVLETIRDSERAEAAYDRRMYRYKAHYSCLLYTSRTYTAYIRIVNENKHSKDEIETIISEIAEDVGLNKSDISFNEQYLKMCIRDSCHPEKVFAEETVFVLYGLEISERKKSFFPTTRCFCCEKAVRRCF